MILIAGLGNPGEEYKSTRHNVGFMAVDEFSRKNNFPDFELNKKSKALVSKSNDILLVKPQTFMNKSGGAVKILKSNRQISDIIVIHDDIDLPVGKIKIVQERGSAGHKGVESIIKAIGNKNLVRIRIGIQPQGEASKETPAERIVLKNFTEKERGAISQSIQKAVYAIDLFTKKGLEATMNEYNK